MNKEASKLADFPKIP